MYIHMIHSYMKSPHICFIVVTLTYSTDRLLQLYDLYVYHNLL